MIRIILAEDHNIVRNGIKMLLESQRDISVVAEANNGKEVLNLLQSGIKADVVITDLNIADLDTTKLIKTLKKTNPRIKVVILSVFDQEKYVTQAFIDGAWGYLLKNIRKEEMLFALKYISQGEKYLCTELSQKLLNKLILSVHQHPTHQALQIDFSVREMEILQLIAEGFTNKEMAEKLFLSKRTVEGHRQAIIDKTGSKNTAALIRFALVNGLIQE